MITTSTTCPIPVDAPTACPYCGKPLAVTVVEFPFGGRTVRREVPCFGSCGCELARAKLGAAPARPAPDRDSLHMAQAEVPGRYTGLDVPCADVLQAADDGRPVWIKGPNGTGKTALAVSALKAWIHQGERGLFAYVPDMLRRMSSEFGELAGEYYGRLCSVPLLVMDDLGKEEPTERRAAAISSVIDARSRGELSTIVTSNFSPAQYVARFEGSSTARGIASRMLQGAFVKTLDGADRRLQ